MSSPVVSHTVSTAQSSGWVWDIALPTRRGVGYTFSSTHTNTDKATEELLAYVEENSHLDAADIPAPREIRFEPGYRETFWKNNCVAIGISAGFIEPLEASALVMIELAAGFVRDELPVTRSHMDLVSKRFNKAFIYRWERIIDFLKLHYVLSQRSDTAYWMDHRKGEGLSESLKELLDVWRYRPPQAQDFDSSYEVFPAASYQYVLYGMGFASEGSLTRGSQPLSEAYKQFDQSESLRMKMSKGLPSNRDLLAKLAEHVSS